MRIISKAIHYNHEEIFKDKAREIYKDNPFKLELIEQIPGETVGFSRQGDFYDLCRGGHIPNTGIIKAVKLMNIAGAYWRGDEHNPQLEPALSSQL